MVPMVRLLADIGYVIPSADIRVLVDAEAALAYTRRPRHNWRNAHIDRRYHSVRDRYHKGEFALFHVKGEFNVADLLTKNTKTDVHRRHREVVFRQRQLPPWGEMVTTEGDGLYVPLEEEDDNRQEPILIGRTTRMGSRYTSS